MAKGQIVSDLIVRLQAQGGQEVEYLRKELGQLQKVGRLTEEQLKNQARSVRALGAATNQVDGAVYVLTVIQDGTGSRTLSFNSNYKFTGGSAPTLTTTAAARDILVFVSNGTNMFEIGRSLNVS